MHRPLLIFLAMALSGSSAASGDGQRLPEQTDETCGCVPSESSPSWLDDEWDGLPRIETDGGFSLELGGRFQLDYRDYHGDAVPENEFLVRRARVKIEGNVHPRIEYKLQTQFNEPYAEGVEIKDAYFDIDAHERLRMQVGQLKAPFSQEELQSSKYMEFVERSLVNNLAPGRAIGVMGYGATDARRVQYEFAAMSRSTELPLLDALGREQIDRRRQTELYARGRLKLMDSGILENLQFGGALGFGLSDGDSVNEVETSSESFDVLEAVALHGTTTRQNLEAWWLYENVSVQGEYLHWRGERRGLGPDGSDLDAMKVNGFMIQGIWILTGEKKGTDEVHPARPFLRGGGLGAFEIGVRYDLLDWQSSDLNNRVQSWTVGLNWWLFDRMVYRIDANWDHFRSPPFTASPGDRTRFTLLSRFQIFF